MMYFQRKNRMLTLPSYKLFPLGDAAITIDFGNIIDETINEAVLSLYHSLQRDPLYSMIEAVPAYSSLTIYYDVASAHKKTASGMRTYDWITGEIEKRLQQPLARATEQSALITIPVCYDPFFAPDLEQLASRKGLSIEEVINIHTAKEYRVYMLGFLPGFCYMGEVDERIVSPRKPEPVNVESGSVGIAGKQTGVYPFASPGGWQIIGRTPLLLFDKDKENPALLKPGDRVRFTAISKHEFANH
jgi:inhibitor of KinA